MDDAVSVGVEFRDAGVKCCAAKFDDECWDIQVREITLLQLERKVQNDP